MWLRPLLFKLNESFVSRNENSSLSNGNLPDEFIQNSLLVRPADFTDIVTFGPEELGSYLWNVLVDVSSAAMDNINGCDLFFGQIGGIL